MSQFFNMSHMSHLSFLRNMQNQNNGLVWINYLRKKTSNHSHKLQAMHVADHEKKEILFGAPGTFNWTGTLLKKSLYVFCYF